MNFQTVKDSDYKNEIEPGFPMTLPWENMYNIQIGNKCFKLSGASLSSDSPSYFTKFFLKPENASATLFIDRSPKVFEKIVMHLQGYYLEIQSPAEFSEIFADAFYYDLPNLKTFLYQQDIFVEIGGEPFKFSQKLISTPGNTPNFFTVSYSQLFQDPTSLMAGKKLLRPPRQAPLALIDRCPKLFHILLSFLRGYDLRQDSDFNELRDPLIKECQYYRFFEVEQRLIKCETRRNPFEGVDEIVIELKYLKPRGLRLNGHECTSAGIASSLGTCIQSFLQYERPYMEKVCRDLVIEINSDDCVHRNNELYVTGEDAVFLRSLFKNFISHPIFCQYFKLSDNTITIPAAVPNTAHVNVDGKNTEYNAGSGIQVTRSQWKVAVDSSNFYLKCVALEGVTNAVEWVKKRGFLGS